MIDRGWRLVSWRVHTPQLPTAHPMHPIALLLVFMLVHQTNASSRWCSPSEVAQECTPLLLSTQAPRPCVVNGTYIDVSTCTSRPCTGDEQVSVCGYNSHNCQASCVYSIDESRSVCTPQKTNETCTRADSPARYCSYDEINSVVAISEFTPAQAIASCRVVCDDALTSSGCSLEYTLNGTWVRAESMSTLVRPCDDVEFSTSCADERDGCVVSCENNNCTILNRCAPSAVFVSSTRVPAYQALSVSDSAAQCGPGWFTDPDRGVCRASSCDRTNARGYFNCTCDLSTCGCPNRIPVGDFPCGFIDGEFDTKQSESGLGTQFDAQLYCGPYARSARIMCVSGVCTLVADSCVCKTNVYPFGGMICGGIASVCTRAETISCGPGVTSCVFVHNRGLYQTPTRPAISGEYVKCGCLSGTPQPIGPLFAPYTEDTVIPTIMAAVDADLNAQISSAWWQPTTGEAYALPNIVQCPRLTNMDTGESEQCGGGLGLFASGGDLVGCICNPATQFYTMGVLGFAECVDIPSNSTHLLIHQQIERIALTANVPSDADTPQLATELCSYAGGCMINTTSVYARRVTVRMACPLSVAYMACGTWFDPSTDSCNVTAEVYPSFSSRSREEPIFVRGSESCGCVSEPEYVFRFDPDHHRPCYSAHKARIACSAALTQQLCELPVDNRHTSEAILELTDGNLTHRFDTNAAGYSIDLCEAYPFRTGSARLVEGSCPGMRVVRPCTSDERESFCRGGSCWASCENATAVGAGGCRLWGACPVSVDCPDSVMTNHCNGRNRDETGCGAKMIQTRFGLQRETYRASSCSCLDGFSGDSCEIASNTSTCVEGSMSARRCGPVGSYTACIPTSGEPVCVCAGGRGHVAPLSQEGTFYDMNTLSTRTRPLAKSGYGLCEGVVTVCDSDAAERLGGTLTRSCTMMCPEGNSTSPYCRLLTWHCRSSGSPLQQSTEQFMFEFGLMNSSVDFRTMIKPCDYVHDSTGEIQTQYLPEIHSRIAEQTTPNLITGKPSDLIAAAQLKCGPGIYSINYIGTTGRYNITACNWCGDIYVAGYMGPDDFRMCAYQSYTNYTECTAYDKTLPGMQCYQCAQAIAANKTSDYCKKSNKLVHTEDYPGSASALRVADRFGLRKMFNLYGRLSEYPEAIYFLNQTVPSPLSVRMRSVPIEVATYACGEFVQMPLNLTCSFTTWMVDPYTSTTDPHRNPAYPQWAEPTCPNFKTECKCIPGAGMGRNGVPCSRNYTVVQCGIGEAASLCGPSSDGCTKRVYIDGSSKVHTCNCPRGTGTPVSFAAYQYSTSTWYGADYGPEEANFFTSCTCAPNDPACRVDVSTCKAQELCGAFAASARAACVNGTCTPKLCTCSQFGVRPPGTTDFAQSCSAYRSACTSSQVASFCAPQRDTTGYATSIYTTCDLYNLANGTSGFLPGSCGGLVSTTRPCASDNERLRSCGAGTESCMWDGHRAAPLPSPITRACVCKPDYYWDSNTMKCVSAMVGVFACSNSDIQRCPSPGNDGCRRRIFRVDANVNSLAISTLRTIDGYMRGTGSYTLLTTLRSSYQTVASGSFKDIAYVECRCIGPFGITPEYTSQSAFDAAGVFWQDELGIMLRTYDATGGTSGSVVVPAVVPISCPTLTKTQLFNYEILYGTCPGLGTGTPVCNGRGSCRVMTGSAIDSALNNASQPLRVGLDAISRGLAIPGGSVVQTLINWLRGSATELVSASGVSRVYFLSDGFAQLAGDFPTLFSKPRMGEMFTGSSVMSTFDFDYTTPPGYRTIAFSVNCVDATTTTANTAIQSKWLSPHAAFIDNWSPYTQDDVLTDNGRDLGAKMWLLQTPSLASDFVVRLGHVTGSNAIGIPSLRFKAWGHRVSSESTCVGDSMIDEWRGVIGGMRDANLYKQHFGRSLRNQAEYDKGTRGILMQDRVRLQAEIDRRAANAASYVRPSYPVVDGHSAFVQPETGKYRNFNVRYGEFSNINSPCTSAISQPLERTGGFMHTYDLTAAEAFRSVANRPSTFVWEDHETFSLAHIDPEGLYPSVTAIKEMSVMDARPYNSFRLRLNMNRDERYATQCEQVHSNECQTQSCQGSIRNKQRWNQVSTSGRYTQLYDRMGPLTPDLFKNGSIRLDRTGGNVPVICENGFRGGGSTPFRDPERARSTQRQSEYAIDRNGFECRSLYKTEAEYKSTNTRQWCACSLSMDYMSVKDKSQTDPSMGTLVDGNQDELSLEWDRVFGHYARTQYQSCSDERGARYSPIRYENRFTYLDEGQGGIDTVFVYFRTFTPIEMFESHVLSYCHSYLSKGYTGWVFPGWTSAETTVSSFASLATRASVLAKYHGKTVPSFTFPSVGAVPTDIPLGVPFCSSTDQNYAGIYPGGSLQFASVDYSYNGPGPYPYRSHAWDSIPFSMFMIGIPDLFPYVHTMHHSQIFMDVYNWETRYGSVSTSSPNEITAPREYHYMCGSERPWADHVPTGACWGIREFIFRLLPGDKFRGFAPYSLSAADWLAANPYQQDELNGPFYYIEPRPLGAEWFRIANCDITMHRGALFLPLTSGMKVNDFTIKPFLDTLNRDVCTDQELVRYTTGTASERCPPLYSGDVPNDHPKTPRDDPISRLLSGRASRLVDFQMFTPSMCMSPYTPDCSVASASYFWDNRAVQMTAMFDRESLKQCPFVPYANHPGYHPEHVAARGYSRAYSMFRPGYIGSEVRLLPTLISYYNGSIFTNTSEMPVNVMRSSPLYLHHHGVEMHPQSIRRTEGQSSMIGTSAFGFSHAIMYDWAAGHTASTPYGNTEFKRPYAYTNTDVVVPKLCYTLADIGFGSKTTRETQACSCVSGFGTSTTTIFTKLGGVCDLSPKTTAATDSNDVGNPYYMYPPRYQDKDYGYCTYGDTTRCIPNPNWDPRKWCVNGRFDMAVGLCVCDPGYTTPSDGAILEPCSVVAPVCPGVKCPGDRSVLDTTSCTCSCAPVGPFSGYVGSDCFIPINNGIAQTGTDGNPHYASECGFQGANVAVNNNASACECFSGADGGGWSGPRCNIPIHNNVTERACVANGGTMVVSTECTGLVTDTSVVNVDIITKCALVAFSTCQCGDPTRFGRTCELTRCPIGPNGKICSGVGACIVGSSGVGTCKCDLPCDLSQSTSVPDCGTRYENLLAGNLSALPWWGGCACEYNLRLTCTNPGTSSLCGGVNTLTVNAIDLETAKCGREESLITRSDALAYRCYCNKTGDATRFGTYCEQSICPSDSSGNACSGRTCKLDGTCDCNTDRSSLNSPRVRMGTRCEILAPSCEGASIAGIPTICNNHGQCMCNGTSCGCTCDRFYDGAQCQFTQCLVPCGAGTCVLPSGSSVRTCTCANPQVIALGSTGSCDRNACLYGAQPSVDGQTCVCTSPTAIYEIGCREPACPRDPVSGYYCGPLHPQDTPTQFGYPLSSTLKSCDTTVLVDGCRCHQGYVKNATTGSCDPFCSPSTTASQQLIPDGIACTCVSGYEGVTCGVKSCPDNAVVNSSSTTSATKCICPSNAVYYLGMCIDANCTANGSPVVPVSTTTVTDCSTGVCKLVRATSYCSCARGWMGADCGTPVCANGGSWNTDTSKCQCALGWSGPTCAVSKCVAPYVLDSSGMCACPAGYSGFQCGTITCGAYGTRDALVPSRCICSSVASNTFCSVLDCVGGSVVTDNGVRSCSCPLDFSVAKAADGALSCEHRSCGSAGVPMAISSNVTCKCDDTYTFVRWANTSYRCVPDCYGHGVPNPSVLDSCLCFDGYSGKRCATAIPINNSTSVNTTKPPDPVNTTDPTTPVDPTPIPDACANNATCVCIRNGGSNCGGVVPPLSSSGASTPIAVIVGSTVGGGVAIAVAFTWWVRFRG